MNNQGRIYNPANNQLELNCKTIKTEVIDHESHEQVDETNLNYNYETGEILHFAKVEKDEFGEESHHIEDIKTDFKITDQLELKCKTPIKMEVHGQANLNIDETNITYKSETGEKGHFVKGEKDEFEEELQHLEGISIKSENFMANSEGIDLNETKYISESLSENSKLQKNIKVSQRVKNYKSDCKCNICGRLFTRRYDLKKHILIHTGEKNFKCTICDKSFYQRGHLNEHLLLHSGEKNYACDICQKSFILRRTLRKHISVHSKNFKCTICDKSFSHSGTLKEHLFLHTGEKNYKCDICEKSFRHGSGLRSHKSTVHHGIKKKGKKCEICEKSFISMNELNQHKQVHHIIKEEFEIGEELKIEVLDYELVEAPDLDHKSETEEKTINVKNFKCTICDRSFSQLRTLKDHLLLHTGEKNYKCDICEKTFTQRAGLRKHKSVHSSLESHKCDICERVFTLKGNLKRHMSVHTGEKNFKCTICDKSFSQKVTLKVHLFVHTGEKNYKCDICEKSFASMNELNHHKQVHNIIKEEFEIGEEVKMEVLDYELHKLENEEKPMLR